MMPGPQLTPAEYCKHARFEGRALRRPPGETVQVAVQTAAAMARPAAAVAPGAPGSAAPFAPALSAADAEIVGAAAASPVTPQTAAAAEMAGASASAAEAAAAAAVARRRGSRKGGAAVPKACTQCGQPKAGSTATHYSAEAFSKGDCCNSACVICSAPMADHQQQCYVRSRKASKAVAGVAMATGGGAGSA